MEHTWRLTSYNAQDNDIGSADVPVPAGCVVSALLFTTEAEAREWLEMWKYQALNYKLKLELTHNGEVVETHLVERTNG